MTLTALSVVLVVVCAQTASEDDESVLEMFPEYHNLMANVKSLEKNVTAKLATLEKNFTETVASLRSTACRDGWEYYSGSCYKLDLKRPMADWVVLKLICERVHKANVLRIDNALEANFIRNYLRDQPVRGWYHTGVRDWTKNGNFTWMDGTKLTYTDFADGESSKKGDNTALMDYRLNLKWRVDYYRRSAFLVCEEKK